MRTILFAIAIAVLSAPVAESEPFGGQKSGHAVSSGKLLPVKGEHAGNPCAVYGSGFTKVDGTDTCVNIGGAVSIGDASSVRSR
jgi:hypothetical protein